MLNLDTSKMENAIVAKAAEDILAEMPDISNMIERHVKSKVDEVFADAAGREIEKAASEAFKDAMNREYFKVDSFGKKSGEPTTISKQLQKLVSDYWSERVDRNGKTTSDLYSQNTSRAEYLMAQICADDFSKQMRHAAVSVTAALKDGFRAQLAGHVDALLDELFRVKSLQDQGKAKKPY